MKLIQSILLICSVCSAVLFSTAAFAKDAPDTNFSIPINVNEADAESLAVALKGVGQKKAEAIIAYRNDFGSS